jgi:hypothetical protein
MTSEGSDLKPSPLHPPSVWTLADLIDFEILLSQDDADANAPWRKAWAQRRPEAMTAGGVEARRSLFRAWLELRRDEPGSQLPGEAIATGWRWLGTIGTATGILLGASVTGALLHYKGSEPVNVAWFLACTLGIPWLILLGAGVVSFLRRTTGALQDFQPLRHLLSGMAWLCSAGLRRLPGEQRERLRARLAILHRKREIYGSLTTWPVVIVTQLVAVGYSLGILGTLLAHVAATDLAFGWQSTLDLSPEVAHRIVSVVATPWSWFAPHAHPNLAQISSSRFAYADGITALDRSALASWWPFLAYAVAFYGLLLRSGLLLLAVARLRRIMGSWTFDHEGCNALARQLSGPIFHAQSETAALQIPESKPATSASPSSIRTCLALVATDLEASPDLVRQVLARAFGPPLAPRSVAAGVPPAVEPGVPPGGISPTTIQEASPLPVVPTFPVQIDHPSGNAETLQALSAPQNAGSTIVVIAPAHRAPIKAIALFLRKVADTTGPGREVILLLTGRRSGDVFAAVPDADFQHWRNLIAIHQLPVSLERLPTP